MLNPRQTLSKEERLHSRKKMDLLFEKGRSSSAYPLKLIFLESHTEQAFPAQMMFVVPKRSYKKAHDRNKLKRRMREAYRLNKQPLYKHLGSNQKKLICALIYTSRKQEPYKNIEAAIIKLIGGSLIS